MFITGATGYLGLVLIYKLLMYCPDIGNLYLLIRGKKGVTPDERLRELKEHFLLQKIERAIPGQLSKVLIVQGDSQEIGLAISIEDRAMLRSKINVIFHMAATVRFDNPLGTSVSINVRGTKEVLGLAKQMEELAAFVHCSSAYVHCHLQNEVIREEIYPPETFSVEEVLDMCDVTSMEQTKEVIEKSLRPNVCHFTKSMTEQLLREQREDLPLSVVRPTIICGAIKEPLPGWVVNMDTATGGIAAGGHGILRSMLGNPNLVGDIVPVDVVANLMCAVAYKTATTEVQPQDIPVYHCSSGCEKPLCWRDHEIFWKEAALKYPFEKIVAPPAPGHTVFQESKILDRIYRVLLHTIPAHIIDLIARLLGHKPFLVRLVSKMHGGLNLLEYFTTREWTWANDNVLALSQELNTTDVEFFNFRMCDLDWREYWLNHFIMLRNHYFKCRPETVEASRLRLGRLKLIFGAVKSVVAFAFLAFIGNLILRLV